MLSVTNSTAAAYLMGVVMRGGDGNAFTECGCEPVSNWLLRECGGCILAPRQLLLSIQQQQQQELNQEEPRV